MRLKWLGVLITVLLFGCASNGPKEDEQAAEEAPAVEEVAQVDVAAADPEPEVSAPAEEAVAESEPAVEAESADAEVVALDEEVVAADPGPNVVNLSSAGWLGGLNLSQEQLAAIKKAVEKSFVLKIDQIAPCSEDRLGCEVRAAREWVYDGERHRNIVVNVHTVGHASNTVYQINGEWPQVVTQ
ncbi:MAG: hypothetical protein GXP10_01350 [Gammaproteobacteria bacterium]|nr:hypothetical protein [Gammaproteobacteria bacterium]